MMPRDPDFVRKLIAGGLAGGLAMHVLILLTAPAAIGGGRLAARGSDPGGGASALAPPVEIAAVRPADMVPAPQPSPPPLAMPVVEPRVARRPADDPFAHLARVDRQLDRAIRAAIDAGLRRRDVNAVVQEWDYALRFADEDPRGVADALERMAEDLDAFATGRPV